MPVTIDGTTGITTPAIVNGSALAFRNKLINGNFDIWQRGTSLISGTGGRFLADRFTNGSAGTTCTADQSVFTLGQTAVPNEPDYYISTAVTSVAGASNNATLHQHIESVKSCAGKTVTLSFYAKSNASRNIAVELYQNFGTGGTPSTNVSIPAGLKALTTSWQKFTVTVSIPSISGKTLGTDGNDSLVAYFWFDAGSSFATRASSLGQQSGTFDIAQVQLEEGSVATPFENRPIGTELALCQRYYHKRNATAYGVPFMSAYNYYQWSPSGTGVGGRGFYQFPVEFRAIPTFSSSVMSTFLHQDGLSTGYTLDSLQSNSSTVYGTLMLWRHTSGSATSGQGGALIASNTVTTSNLAYLAFSAEL